MTMNASHTQSPAKRIAERGEQTDITSAKPGADLSHNQESMLSLNNGPAAAAILAAGIGCFAVGLFALLGDAFKPVANFFNFYHPTGPLSGVTTSAIVVWLLSWFALSRQWQSKSVALGRVTGIAFTLLILAVLLTFPPFMDLLQGK
ncbi:hypothetical protein [Paraburkholderia mimosarum]|uniref:hypothetical protein n=2 Tax=Paraburkholderia mimosarum TaxID=312026 RepID=UPI000486A83E|nr:hypothetical protein [Paraburkholderia mimosarum]